jgi:cell wall-associated NlpC family hydrolase
VPAELLLEGFENLFERVGSAEADIARPGDVLLLKYGNPAVNLGHMAIYVGRGRAVHAYPGRREQVSERDLAVLFHKHPLHSVWRWKRAARCR